MATHDSQTTLSIVVPVYRGRDCLDELYRRLIDSLTQITNRFEIILVDDGCPENSWEKIAQLANTDERVIGVKLSRNFGQHAAITAGLDRSKGTWIVVMDCDLQDQPEEIHRLFQKKDDGYPVVFARREHRQDSLYRKAGSFLFSKILAYLTDTPHDASIANFGIYHRRVIEAVVHMREKMRFFPLMVKWSGFRSAIINVKHAKRLTGRSSYSLFRLIRLASEVAIAYSNKPLRLIIAIGFFISTLAFSFAVYLFALAAKGQVEVMGWSSIMVSIWFLAGLTLMTLGIVGLYVGKTFDETKQRPIYVIQETYEKNH